MILKDERADVQSLREVMNVVIWFLIVCSIVSNSLAYLGASLITTRSSMGSVSLSGN